MTDRDARIVFDPANETMDVDFSNFDFTDSTCVDRFYDEIEQKIARSGSDRWYFLVNLNGTRIEPDAWMRYAKRGRLLNEEHGLGSVRYDASEATHNEIIARANSESFDANLFEARDDAIARIAELRAAAPKRFPMKARVPSKWGEDEFRARTTLHHDQRIMEADFSDFTFETLGDVHDFYDFLDHEMRITGRRWFFMVNYRNTRIMPEVWGAFANRGKKLNMDFSLGSVRYDASPETKREIAERANSEAFDPNLCPSRDAAFERVNEMRQSA